MGHCRVRDKLVLGSSLLTKQVPLPSMLAATSAQAVKVAACPSTRYCARSKLRKHSLQHASRRMERATRQHLTKALQAEVEKPVAQKRRGRKKGVRPDLPTVSHRPGFRAFCTGPRRTQLAEDVLLCSLLTFSKQSRSLLLLVGLVCTQANTVCRCGHQPVLIAAFKGLAELLITCNTCVFCLQPTYEFGQLLLMRGGTLCVSPKVRHVKHMLCASQISVVMICVISTLPLQAPIVICSP